MGSLETCAKIKMFIHQIYNEGVFTQLLLPIPRYVSCRIYGSLSPDPINLRKGNTTATVPLVEPSLSTKALVLRITSSGYIILLSFHLLLIVSLLRGRDQR